MNPCRKEENVVERKTYIDKGIDSVINCYDCFIWLETDLRERYCMCSYVDQPVWKALCQLWKRKFK